MGAGIAASPHCAERRICRCSQPLTRQAEASCVLSSILAHQLRRRFRKSIPIRRRVRLLQRPFLDQPPFAPLARSPRGLNRVRARKTGSSGASDRLVRIVAPFGPESLPFASHHRLPAEIGASIPSSRGTLGLPSRSPIPYERRSESLKAEKSSRGLWITGISRIESRIRPGCPNRPRSLPPTGA